MTKTFETVTCGKWILAGEHAVLRGSAALVFPLHSAQLHFQFHPGSGDDIQLQLSGSAGSELDLLFWGVLEKACGLTGIRRKELAGQVHMRNDIPVGAGLGASAAFCVAVSRWFHYRGLFAADKIEEFARELENLFHGESSGVDIAVSHLGKPLKFRRNGERQIFEPQWQPTCYLSYSGQRGVTRECVAKVKDLSQKNSDKASVLDEQMKNAVALAEKALLENEAVGFAILEKSMTMAADCFKQWGLFEGVAERKAHLLYGRGATVVKPTGSGGGGFLLGLWKTPPTDQSDLIPCYR